MKLNIINYADIYLQCIKDSYICKVRRYKMRFTIARYIFRPTEIDIGSVQCQINIVTRKRKYSSFISL